MGVWVRGGGGSGSKVRGGDPSIEVRLTVRVSSRPGGIGWELLGV